MGEPLHFAATMLIGLAVAMPASARVFEESGTNFVIRQSIEVKATPGESWDILVRPSQWWRATHTFS
jgi:hypothetical protein